MDLESHGATSKTLSLSGRVWTFLRIMNVRLRFIFLMVLVGLVVGYWENITNYYDRWTRPAPSAAAGSTEQAIEYYCPMHPNIVRSEPGNCPICGMPLSERAKAARQPLSAGALGRVELTPLQVETGRIGTSPIGYRALSREIRTVGIVDYDETRRAFIAARIKGRIDKLFIDFVGQKVTKGDPLVWLYSPDLLIAQNELLSAVRSVEQAKASGGPALATAQSMVSASRKKLTLWGITPEQVDEIVRRGSADTHLTIYSPIAGIVTDKKVLEGRYVQEGDNLYTIADLGRVWMELKIFEDQIAGVQIGTAVEVTGTAYPNEIFAGRITFVAYTVDPATRTVSSRVEIDNPDYKLKPGMYAWAVVRLPMGQVTEVPPSSAPASSPAMVDHGPASMPAAPSAATAPLAQAYLALAESYAKDQADPAVPAALALQAHKLADQGPAQVREAAAAVAREVDNLAGKGLAEQRAAFKSISGKIIDLLKAHPPPDLTLHVAHCPMAKADWLQKDKPIRNPYYGKAMLDCGAITGTIQPARPAGQERFENGYFCPIRPDRLYERPELCPIDKFPMKYVRLEKVLAVPVSAVIDTGTRQVAYREAAPGVFDMVELKLGERAGEFYPVLSGLKPGDRVATAGAFLVDAENRLNPAASAQYFGATGGPGGSK